MKYVNCESDWLYTVVDTQLCELRNTSRPYPIFSEFPNCTMFFFFRSCLGSCALVPGTLAFYLLDTWILRFILIFSCSSVSQSVTTESVSLEDKESGRALGVLMKRGRRTIKCEETPPTWWAVHAYFIPGMYFLVNDIYLQYLINTLPGKNITSAVSSTDQQIDRFSTFQAAWTDRAFSIISLAIAYWRVTPLDATRVDDTIILVLFRTRRQQIDTRRSGYTRQSKVENMVFICKKRPKSTRTFRFFL